MNGCGRATGYLYGCLTLVICVCSAFGADPDHPIITEVFSDPVDAADGPVGRNPTNEHQEYIEIWLPTETGLAAGLSAAGLNMTFYEIEGDRSSTGNTLVNYRFDLPTFCVLNNPAMCPAGTIPRPSSGVVVLGSVDYAGSLAQGTCASSMLPCDVFLDNCAGVNEDCLVPAPTALAGAPGTRVGLINGGITATDGTYTFVAINGHHFGAPPPPDPPPPNTTNFPLLDAENLIDLVGETSSGIVQNGSGAYLLMNRGVVPGYLELCDDQHAGDCTAGADPNLPSATVGLRPAALLDGCAGNDAGAFNVTLQPYDPLVTGCATDPAACKDLEQTLPLNGAFSLLVAQIPEKVGVLSIAAGASGYARKYVDVAKTTETAAADNPATDAQVAYQHIQADGPFVPTPGRVVRAGSAPELGVPANPAPALLSQTAGTVPIPVANIGGNFPIDITPISAGASSDASIGTIAIGSGVTGVASQSYGFPTLLFTCDPSGTSAAGASAATVVTFTGVNNGAGLAALNGTQDSTVHPTVFKPTKGLDVNGDPIETTVFLALHGLIDEAGVNNELLGTDLGIFLAAQPDITLLETEGSGAELLDPLTNLRDKVTYWGQANPLIVATVPVKELPAPLGGGEECTNWLSPAGPLGTLDFADTVALSAVVLSGDNTYNDSISTQLCCQGGTTPGFPCTAVPNTCLGGGLCLSTQTIRGIRLNLPDTRTFGGAFSPSENMHFVDPDGDAGDPTNPLTNATTTRTFEVAIIDVNVRNNPTGSVESGANDDFGIVVEVLDTEGWSTYQTGQFVFLSYTGGTQGADIDTLRIPPGDDPSPTGLHNIVTLMYLDLDNLHDVLGIISIEAIYVIDAENGGQLDVVEAFSLNPVTAPQCGGDAQCEDGNLCTTNTCVGGACVSTDNSLSCSDGDVCTINDTCSAGNCVGGGPLSCDDQEFCTGDSCVPASGCIHWNNTAPCSDGSACTVGDVCLGGSCQAGAPVDCTLLNDDCAIGTCNPADGTCFQDIGTLVGTVCRAAAGLCDVVEICVGDATCPMNQFTAAGFVCRPAADECDVADECAGDSAACPDACAPAATLCDNGGGPGSSTCDGSCFCIGSGPSCPGGTAAECCDANTDGVTDDVCAWCACDATVCSSVPRAVPADVGGAFGACLIDGFCNIHDRNHALTCFAGTNACDSINVDAGGAFGACPQDGFCNIHDANHALTCFAGTNVCGCGGPAPEHDPIVVGHASLNARPSVRSARAGELVDVDVFVREPLQDLQSYQLHLKVSGGRRGHLELVDVSIKGRRDFVFHGAPDRFDAFNPNTGQMLSGLDSGGTWTAAAGYLATYTYRVSPDAVGAFVVDVAADEQNGDQTYLIATDDGKIEVSGSSPGVITVTTGKVSSRIR